MRNSSRETRDREEGGLFGEMDNRSDLHVPLLGGSQDGNRSQLSKSISNISK